MLGGGGLQILGGSSTDKATSAEGVQTLGTLGALYWDPVNKRIVQLVKNSDGAALTSDRIVAWADQSLFTVTATTVAGGSGGGHNAGAAVSAIAASGFGFIVVRGPAEVKPGAALDANDPVFVDGTDGNVIQVATTVLEAACMVGWAVDLATGDGAPAAITVFIKLL